MQDCATTKTSTHIFTGKEVVFDTVIDKKEYYLYELKNDNKEVVYIGFTDDFEQATKQHRLEKMQFSLIGIVGVTVSQQGAELWQQRRLEQYRESHEGKNPRYNQD